MESEAGRFRRNHGVPVPQARDLAELNEQLLAACQADEQRTVAGREQPVGAALCVEREYLLPLAAEGFDRVEVSFPQVNSLGGVKVKTNAYSAPIKAGTTVQVQLRAARVEIWHAGRRVAEHERCDGRYQEILDLEHYLDVLAHKPGALAGSKPLVQWRQLGRWPASYDQLWAGLIARQGRSAGTKARIALLQLGRRHGPDRLRAAVEAALTLGCWDAAAVRQLLATPTLVHQPPPTLAPGALAGFDRPLPALDRYDELLATVVR